MIERLQSEREIRPRGRRNPRSTLCGSYRHYAAGLAIALASGPALADPVAFTNIAGDPATNASLERSRSNSYSALPDADEGPLITPFAIQEVIALKSHRTGDLPSVALLDYDEGGDTDIYVTNGAGAANAHYSNQQATTGAPRLVDMSSIFGADATGLDSYEECFGDLDGW